MKYLIDDLHKTAIPYVNLEHVHQGVSSKQFINYERNSSAVIICVKHREVVICFGFNFVRSSNCLFNATILKTFLFAATSRIGTL